jgi:hypothetical protein
MLTGRLVNGKVEIPVVVNVIIAPLQKISLMHKFNLKLTLNQDFNAEFDFTSTPAEFSE